MDIRKQTGFKTKEDVIDYLKNGGVIGNFYGEDGEDTFDNDFIILKEDTNEVVHHHSVIGSYETELEMKTQTMTLTELGFWLDNLSKYKSDDGYLPTALFHKNLTVDKDEIKKLGF